MKIQLKTVILTIWDPINQNPSMLLTLQTSRFNFVFADLNIEKLKFREQNIDNLKYRSKPDGQVVLN